MKCEFCSDCAINGKVLFTAKLKEIIVCTGAILLNRPADTHTQLNFESS